MFSICFKTSITQAFFLILRVKRVGLKIYFIILLLKIEKYNFYNIKVDENKQKNLQQIHHLQSLRDWLLPMLMNGQVSVE